jgi:hypothetical protein
MNGEKQIIYLLHTQKAVVWLFPTAFYKRFARVNGVVFGQQSARKQA